MSAEKYLPDASAEGAGDGGEMGTRRAGAADGAVERGDSPGASSTGAAGESEALLPGPADAADARARAAAAESSRPAHAAPGDAEVPAYVPPGLQPQASPHGARARAAGAPPMTILVKPAATAAAEAGEGAADEAPEAAAEDTVDSPGVLDNLKSGVLGAVKGALVPGSAEEDTRNKAGTAAEGGAAEQEEEEQQEEEEESRGKMIAMAIATISK